MKISTKFGGFKPIIGLMGGVMIFGLLLWISIIIHSPDDRLGLAYTILVGICGVVIGWLLGLLASPHNKGEQERFSKYAATISAFITGYAFSKIEPSLEVIFGDGNLVKTPIYGMRVLVFVVCAIVGSIMMYTYREYISSIEIEHESPKSNV